MIRALINTIVTLVILAFFFPNVSFVNWTTILIAGVVLTLVNLIVKPILKLLTLPINIVTFGLFSVVINIGLLWLVTWLVPGFEIQPMVIGGLHLGYIGTLIAISIIISLIQSIVNLFVGGKK